jgi:hypothetical protein
MYVNQIDNIIDNILDKLFLEGLSNDVTFKKLIEEKIINYVEYYEKINQFIQKFLDGIDTNEIQKLINNKENLIRIMDIIKRYIAYYYFLSLAFYYTGTLQNFRDNLIQYSKLQEHSKFIIRNFFDTENNYQLIRFYRIIKDVSKILLMTDLQKKELDMVMYKDALDFLDGLGEDYINSFILMVNKNVNNGDVVVINTHNLIKTIVFSEIYRNQEQKLVFDILNEIEETTFEYMYIDIIVSKKEILNFETFRQFFIGDPLADDLAETLYELINIQNRISPIPSIDQKNNNFIRIPFITPVVDDFLRYHRDTEKIETDIENKSILPLIHTNNAKNIKLALLYQQRKKKENTKAQLIINKIDVISDYYSPNIRNNNEAMSIIKKYFQGPLFYRKAVMFNYIEEVRVLNKIINQGRAMESNEYFLELKQNVKKAYFNFKDFQKYGTSLIIEDLLPLNLIRYSNIENQNQFNQYEIEMRTVNQDETINIVGIAINPLDINPIQCTRKDNMVDIRQIEFKYQGKEKVKVLKDKNGYKMFTKIIKHLYIDTIVFYPSQLLITHDLKKIKELNKDITHQLIYWIYDINLDIYETDTYENIKIHNFQKNIRFMNAKIYDTFMIHLLDHLIYLIHKHHSLSLSDMQKLIELFVNKFHLPLTENEKIRILNEEYLYHKVIENPHILEVIETENKPQVFFLPKEPVFTLNINMLDPINIIPYHVITYTHEEESSIANIEINCEHENMWKEINKEKFRNVNLYNTLVTQFIEKYAIESIELDFICKVCGQILPIKQYVQDGVYDNITQKFISFYVPEDVPLEEMREYMKYQLSVKYIDALILRLSLITGTNMLTGLTTHTKQKRKGIVKHIIDIILKHNQVNLKKNIKDENRLHIFSQKYHTNEDYDIVFFFELSDNIFNFNVHGSEKELNLNKLKVNNILLYAMLIFMTELNGPQIGMMNYDKIGNIYNFIKYGPKLFENLLIKKNVNGQETVEIMKYPILCYLIFILSYFLIRYNIWFYPKTNEKIFDPLALKVVVNSMVDLINSLTIDAAHYPLDNLYRLTTSKIYTQLATTFQDKSLINFLKRHQAKYAPKMENVEVAPFSFSTYQLTTKLPSLPISQIPNFKIGNGLMLSMIINMLYHIYLYSVNNTDITNCPRGDNKGDYHDWVTKGIHFFCKKCQLRDDEVNGEYDSTTDVYYYQLQRVAHRRCLSGRLHDFINKNGEIVCSFCHKKINDTYTKEELDKMENNLQRIEEEHTQYLIEQKLIREQEYLEEEKSNKDIYKAVISNYQKEGSQIIDKFIHKLNDLLGTDTNLNIDIYPCYLDDDVFVINHEYNGAPLKEPLIVKKSQNKVIFKENHPFFKTDVYYYTDSRNVSIDVFYDAISLLLLGYKEKHKDYVPVHNTHLYLKIIPSLKNRILLLGYSTKYIPLDNFTLKLKMIHDATLAYYQTLDDLVKEHIIKIKIIIDKFISLIYKIKYYGILEEEAEETGTPLESTVMIDNMINKFSKFIGNIRFGKENSSFKEWNKMRELFKYEKVNWKDTNLKINEKLNIYFEIINHYDKASHIMIYYLMSQLIDIIDSNEERIDKINISQIIIELINYVYHLYNMDDFRNTIEIKRFEYLLKASPGAIDILKREQGIEQSKELEKDLEEEEIEELEPTKEEKEELEDLKEEAQALDIEMPEYEDENDDYAESGDFDV